jgi:hypothetical protein
VRRSSPYTGAARLARRVAPLPTSRHSVLLKLARHTIALVGLGALPVHQPTPAIARVAPATSRLAAGVPAGSYVAVLANGEKLPWTTKVPAVQGLVHWARLDLAVLRLTPDGRYTLSYRYSQDVIDSRKPMKMPPARDELSVGRYANRGKTLTFVPTAAKDRRQQTVTAEVVGDDIFLDKTVFVGERPFRVRLLFRRDPSLW